MKKNFVKQTVKRILAMPVLGLFCVLDYITKPILWAVIVIAIAAMGMIVYKLYTMGVLFELVKLVMVVGMVIVVLGIPTKRIASKVFHIKYRLWQIATTGSITRFKADYLYK